MQVESQEEFLRKLGRRVKALREEKGLTQEDFDDGTALSITSRGLQEIEYGNHDVRAYTLYKIAKRLEIPLTDLLDFK